MPCTFSRVGVTVRGVPRAIETYRWGGAAWLVAGLLIPVAGLFGGNPRVNPLTVAIATAGVIGLACVNWSQVRRLARATVRSAIEAPPERRMGRIGLICAAPV